MAITPPAGATRNPDGSFSWTGTNGAQEKNVPHYKLAHVQRVCQLLGKAAFTSGAIPGLTLLGLTRDDALAVIAGMGDSMFYKSMEALKSKPHWQDVYHVATPPNGAMAYVKFTPVVVAQTPAHIVISFKPL
ncbi:type II toxin-antitoxin system MqsR family toxin [Xanthomonas citri]|uniref:type II toxin-antitoxin system MqsR family toxin n=1 Tax=Xanthomonas citri TaxID=346 RepID=UPI000C4A9805|nr:type II toxin-antitoxin system MqsR family toxin [Xanthomonas citri]SOO14194.1 conserved hypothetical protein [Xanthomonas citri pv. fuscans]